MDNATLARLLAGENPPGALTEPGNRGILGWLNDPANQQKLLAIGSGLAGGPTWQQGMAHAGQNLQGTMQAMEQKKAQDQAMMIQIMAGRAAQQKAAQTAEFERQRIEIAKQNAERGNLASLGMGFTLNKDTGEITPPPQDIQDLYVKMHAKAKGPMQWQRMGNVRSADGAPLGQGYFNAEHPGIYIEDKDTGKLIKAPAGTMEITEAAGAPLNQAQYNKLQNEVVTDEIGLDKIANYAKSVGGMDQGLGLLADQISGKFKTMFNSGQLTPAELSAQLAKGQLQGLLGGLRTEILGPGVMTEYDAQRLVSFVGGDVNALTNKDVVKQALGYVWDYKTRVYQRHVEQLNRSSPFYSGDEYKPSIPELPDVTSGPAPAPVMGGGQLSAGPFRAGVTSEAPAAPEEAQPTVTFTPDGKAVFRPDVQALIDKYTQPAQAPEPELPFQMPARPITPTPEPAEPLWKRLLKGRV